MPEFIHPGVFVEETSFQSKTIEGVPTSTAGFVGVAGAPTDSPVLVTELAELERGFGPSHDLRHAGRAFFENGGERLFVHAVAAADAYADGLRALEAVEEIALVAAPGAAVARELVEHAERMRYRFALLDAPAEGIDSSYAAVYRTSGLEGAASGYVAGIYARTEPGHAAEQGSDGNVVRRLDDGSIAIAGGRTLSSDPEWKYVSVRRYFIYLEHSIDRGTQWTVFEPNGEELWATVRDSVSDFLAAELRAGRLAGRTPEDAFFVRCDRSTMTQNDLDDGRLVCLVGVAPVRPAEFVIIQIGRWTADHRCR